MHCTRPAHNTGTVLYGDLLQWNTNMPSLHSYKCSVLHAKKKASTTAYMKWQFLRLRPFVDAFTYFPILFLNPFTSYTSAAVLAPSFKWDLAVLILLPEEVLFPNQQLCNARPQCNSHTTNKLFFASPTFLEVWKTASLTLEATLRAEHYDQSINTVRELFWTTHYNRHICSAHRVRYK